MVLVLIILGIAGTIVMIPHSDPGFDHRLMIGVGLAFALPIGIWATAFFGSSRKNPS